MDALLSSVKGKTNSKGYFDSFSKNIFGEMSNEFEEMFTAGDGRELYGKACAVHSSSMLSFNMFSWISEKPFKYEDVEYNRVFFEVHLPTLIKTTPANLDVVLMGKNLTSGEKTVLFIESKFTEYFKNDSDQMKKMSAAYDDPEKYFTNKGAKWAKLIKEYRKKPSSSSNGYYDGIKQEICHIIGISNLRNPKGHKEFESYKSKYLCSQPEIIGNEKFIFKNILFKVGSKYSEEYKRYSEYEQIYNKLHEDLSELRENIDMAITSYSDLWPIIRDQMSPDRKVFLEDKYMQFAE